MQAASNALTNIPPTRIGTQRSDIRRFYGHNEGGGNSYWEIPGNSTPRFDFQNKLKYKSQVMLRKGLLTSIYAVSRQDSKNQAVSNIYLPCLS